MVYLLHLEFLLIVVLCLLLSKDFFSFPDGPFAISLTLQLFQNKFFPKHQGDFPSPKQQP